MARIRTRVRASAGRWPRIGASLRGAGSGALSVAIHLTILTGLFLWYFSTKSSSPPSTVQIRLGGEVPTARGKEDAAPAPETQSVPLPDMPRQEIPATGQVAQAEAPPASSSRPLLGLGSSPAPGGGTSPFSARTAAGRGQGAGRRWANAASEGAVHRALLWLSKHQHRYGTWSGIRFSDRCPALDRCLHPANVADHDLGLTGLALLAFLGAGHTPEQGEFRVSVSSAANCLRACQSPEGFFLDDRGRHVGQYAQGICAAALCELYGMTRQEQWKEPARRAAQAILAARNPGGGWDYQSCSPKQRNDLSVTSWQWVALRTAEASGVPVDPGIWVDAIDLLVRHTLSDGRVVYADVDPGKGRTSPGMEAISLWARLMLDWPQDSPPVRQLARAVASRSPVWDGDLDRNRRAYSNPEQAHDPYVWYYAAHALSKSGDPEAVRWIERMRDMLVSRQCRSGHAEGSWDPVGVWSGAGGRVYSTAILTLTLEASYRAIPGHQSGNGHPWVLELLQGREARDRGRLAALLPDFGSRIAQDGFALLADDPDAGVRARLACGLAERGDWEPLKRHEGLWALLDPNNRYKLAKLLDESCDPRAGGLYVQLLREGPYLRYQGALALRRSAGSEAAIEPLLFAADAEPEEYIRKELFETLRSLTGQDLPDRISAWDSWRNRRAGGAPAAAAGAGLSAGKGVQDARPAPPPPSPQAVEALERLMEGWIRDPRLPVDLVELFIRIEAAERPVDAEEVRSVLRRMAGHLGDRAVGADLESRLAAMNSLLYGSLGFKAIPQNQVQDEFYLSQVLRFRAGNCVGLSSLYWALGDLAGFPLSGARLPGHYYLVAAGKDGKQRIIETTVRGEAVDEERLIRQMGAVTRRERERCGYLTPLPRQSLAAEVLNSQAARFVDQHRFADALRDFGWAIALDEANPLFRVNRAGLYGFIGREEEALADYDRVERMDPDRVELYTGRASLWIRKGEWDKARSDLDRSFAIRPTVSGWIGRGNCSLVQGRFEEAIRSYTEALKLDPGHPEALRFRGYAHRGAGRWADAAGDLRQAVEKGDRNVATRIELARVLVRGGDPKGAQREMEAVLAQYPSHPDAIALRTELAGWSLR